MPRLHRLEPLQLVEQVPPVARQARVLEPARARARVLARVRVPRVVGVRVRVRALVRALVLVLVVVLLPLVRIPNYCTLLHNLLSGKFAD